MLSQIRDRIAKHLVSLIDHLLEDSPEHSDGYLCLARLKYTQKDYQGAIKDLSIALSHEPTKTDALYWRCRARYDDGQTVPALHDALRATKLCAEDARSFYMLGNIHLSLSNYVEAERAYSMALSLGWTDAMVYAGRGYAHYGMGHYRKSLADLSAAKGAGFDNEMLDVYIETAKEHLHSAS